MTIWNKVNGQDVQANADNDSNDEEIVKPENLSPDQSKTKKLFAN